MRAKGIPINRKNYIALNWPDYKPGGWTREMEAELPDEVR